MRPHLSLVVTGTPRSLSATSLDSLGATSRFIVDEKLTDILGLNSGNSRLRADAIVIDGASKNVWQDQFPIARFVYIARSIKKLSDSITMPNGVRWNAIPIILLVDNYEMEEQIASDYTLRSVLSAWSISRGFHYIYDAIARSVERFAEELIDQMGRVGWRFVNENGRIRRVHFQIPRRKRGFAPELDTKFYSHSADQIFTAPKHRQFALSVLTASKEYTNKSLELYESYIKERGTREAKFQELLEQNPNFVGATHLEMFPHPSILRNGKRRIPDLVIHPFSIGDDGLDAHVVELKTAEMELLRGKGDRKYISGKINAYVAQIQEYERLINDETYLAQILHIFGSKIRAKRLSLIGGVSRTIDRDILERERAQLKNGYGVDIISYDEHLDRQVRRYDAQ